MTFPTPDYFTLSYAPECTSFRNCTMLSLEQSSRLVEDLAEIRNNATKAKGNFRLRLPSQIYFKYIVLAVSVGLLGITVKIE